MAAVAANRKDVSALIECSLCLSTFQQPKCLPCVHTFCLDCLQKYVDQKKIRDSLPCPLCRLKCDIPPQGLSSLRNNFFIQNMIEMERKSERETQKLREKTKCDLCLDENCEQNKPDALNYCLECEQNLCHSCTTYHGRMNSTKSHELVLLSGKQGDQARTVKYGSRFCEKHSNEPLRLYCLKCDACVCVTCMATEHNEHKCQDIKEIFTKYLGLFDINTSELREYLTLGHTSVLNLQAAEVEIAREAVRNEQKVRERCDELRQILENYEQELISEARKFRDRMIKEVKSKFVEIEFHNSQIESFLRYMKELKERGSNYIIAISGKELTTRAEYLLASSKKTLTREMTISHITFLPNRQNSGVEFRRKLIGEVLTGADKTIALHVPAQTEKRITQYGREILLQIRTKSACLVRPRGLPNQPDIILDALYSGNQRIPLNLLGHGAAPRGEFPVGRSVARSSTSYATQQPFQKQDGNKSRYSVYKPTSAVVRGVRDVEQMKSSWRQSGDTRMSRDTPPDDGC